MKTIVFSIIGILFFGRLVAQVPFKEKTNPDQPQIFHQIDTQRNSNPFQQFQPSLQNSKISTIHVIDNQRNTIVSSDSLKNAAIPSTTQNQTKIPPVDTHKRK